VVHRPAAVVPRIRHAASLVGAAQKRARRMFFQREIAPVACSMHETAQTSTAMNHGMCAKIRARPHPVARKLATSDIETDIDKAVAPVEDRDQAIDCQEVTQASTEVVEPGAHVTNAFQPGISYLRATGKIEV
jgi:hypothetical protein